MVKIRLSRVGTTKRPYYRIVAVDSHRRRETRVLEQLGTYDPREGGKVTLDDAALAQWVEKGAQTSDTVSSLLRHRRRTAGEASPEAGGTSAASA